MTRLFWIFAVAICMVAGAQMRADEPAATDTNETTPPAAIVADLQNYVTSGDAGQFLALIGYFNQLGVEVSAVEPPLRAHLNLEESQGVVVAGIADESAAAQAGLKPFDVVLRIDNEQVASPEKFHELIGSRKGKKVVFHVLRNGKPQQIDTTIPNTPVYQFADQYVTNKNVARSNRQYRIGVTLAPADDVLRSHLRLANGEGLVITDIVADGPSVKAGLRRHDVLVQLDGKRLTTVEAFNTQIQEIKDRQVAATLFRSGKEMSLELTPQLSTTAEHAALATVLLENTYLADDRQWVGRVNLNTLHGDLYKDYQPNVRWVEVINGVANAAEDPAAERSPGSADAAKVTAAEQIAQLKRQLDEMQKSLMALESALHAAKAQTSEQSRQSTNDKQP